MYILNCKGKRWAFETKKDYIHTNDPHYFAIGSDKSNTFFLCREIAKDKIRGAGDDIVYFYEKATEDSKSKITGKLICKTESLKEIDKIIDIYLIALKQKQKPHF